MKNSGLRRIIALLVAVILVASMAAVAPAAGAEVSGQFRYETLADGTIRVTGYAGEASEVTIPAKINGKPVTAIADRMFYDLLVTITKIVLPDSITTIGKRAFSNCVDLESINIPDGVTTIGEFAFNECMSLKSIVLPDSVTTVGKEAFALCSRLESVRMPSDLKIIPEDMFVGCYKLNNVSIPGGVTSIGDGAFANCSSLESVTIPAGVTAINGTAFLNCKSLKTVNILGNVKSIGRYAFFGCNSLENFSIPGTVKTIDEYAFSGCACFKDVDMPESVTSIGASAFSGTSIESVSIHAGAVSIGAHAFRGCPNLAEITVDDDNPNYSSLDGVLYNKDRTVLMQYPGGKASAEFTVPDTVNTLDNYSFASISNPSRVVIPDNVTVIGQYAFYYNAGVKSVSLPTGLTEIRQYQFYNCTNLSDINIPDGVAVIGSYAFNKCAFPRIVIPDSVTSIKRAAFSACPDLGKVYFLGSPEQWQDLVENGIEAGNEYLLNAAIVFGGTTGETEYSVVNPPSAGANENFVVKITIPAGASKIGILSENGKWMGKKSQGCVSNGDGSDTWMIAMSVGSKGQRTFGIYADYGEGLADTGLRVNISIVRRSVNPLEPSAAAGAITADVAGKVNAPFTFTVVTDTNVEKVGLFNEKGSGISKKQVSKTVNGGAITWVFTASVGSSGSRTFCVKTQGSDKVWQELGSFTIKITK
ncbi:MAG: leucine-rich repeat domain-containing protein [Clostridia bacterium]|nr:leucine-rich repeat domain-containing protein [Clostridia bacterium]